LADVPQAPAEVREAARWALGSMDATGSVAGPHHGVMCAAGLGATLMNKMHYNVKNQGRAFAYAAEVRKGLRVGVPPLGAVGVSRYAASTRQGCIPVDQHNAINAQKGISAMVSIIVHHSKRPCRSSRIISGSTTSGCTNGAGVEIMVGRPVRTRQRSARFNEGASCPGSSAAPVRAV
jgi:hypothetical protein